MAHCARLLEELAQADPELKSVLSAPGPRGALLAAVARASEALLLVVQSPTRVVYSDPVARLLGSSHAEVFARPLSDEVSLDGDPQDVLAKALGAAGVDAPLGHLMAIPIPDDRGRPCAILCFGEAASAVQGTQAPARQATPWDETALPAWQASSATLRSVLDAIDQGCMIMNERFEVVAVNQMAARIARRSQDRILGATHWSLWPSSVDTPPGRMYRRVLQTGEPQQLEHRYVGEGIDLWLRVHAYRVSGGIVSLFRDITRDMRLLNAESDHRARWEAAKAAVGTLWTLTAAGRMEGIQPGWEAVSGQTSDDYRGYGWLGAIHPEDAERMTNSFEAAVDMRSRLEFTARVRRPDGAWRAVRLCIVPVTGSADQSLSEWVGAAHEIQA